MFAPPLGEGQAASDEAAGGAPTPTRRGLRLVNRLLLLILACLLPTVVLGVVVQLDQRAERKAQLGDLALRQAELLNADIGSIAEGARTLVSTAAEIQLVRWLDPGCRDRLEAVNHSLPSFAFIALIDWSGQLICSSVAGLEPVVQTRPAWVAEALAADIFGVGRFATADGVSHGFVPFFMPIGSEEADRRGVIVAGLGLDWLSAHLNEMKPVDSRLLHRSALTVADRDGVVLARMPRPAEFVGKPFPPAAGALVNAAQAGVTRLKSIDGTERVVGYIPAPLSASGLMVSAGFFEPDLMADINRATWRGGLLLAATVLAAVLLSLVAARRFIGRPTAALVDAARRWREGDLSARAAVHEARSEFGQIAAACNAMACALQRRQDELQQEARLLESRVAARTAELSDANNRLQVEIAQHRRTGAALVQAQKLQTVGQLAGGIAHDFNNLLATILGSLELLGRGLSRDQERLRSMIERASDAVQRGAQLTGRLLAFARRRPLAVRSTDINKLIRDLGALFATSALGRRIKVQTRLDPALWPATVEPSQVEAAILNLVLNARDAMPDGGVLTIATANQTHPGGPGADGPPGDYVRITVSDTGEGMPPEVVRHAFDPFYTTKGAAGSGLGLSQVAGTAKEAGGTVRIASAPGDGTAVTLLFPRAAAAPPAPSRASLPGSVRRWHVLLVDDDPAIRQVTGDMLTDLGCRVTTTDDAEEALGILAGDGDGPDLLLVDYAMPGMTGLALAAAARRQGFTGAVVLATGYAEPVEPDLPDEAAPDETLRKPFTMEQLAAVLSRMQAARRDGSVMAEPA